MLTIVGEQLIDHSRATVDSVVDSKTELIRRDIQQPMAEAKQNVDKAVGSIKSVERDLGTVRQWFEDELGVEFDTAVPEARD